MGLAQEHAVILSFLPLLECLPHWKASRDQPPPPLSDSPGAFLYEEGTILDFSIDMTKEAMNGLGLHMPDVHATLTYEGVSWDVGVHLKGSSTYQGIHGKPSFKIDMAQWVDNQTILGVRRLTLNNMVFDPSMLREHVAYHLYEAMGVPTPRHGYARVKVNGDSYGLYGIVETLDKHFLRRNFPGDSDGNLYDSTFNTADLTGAAVGNFDLQVGTATPPYADLQQLAHDVDSSNILDVLNRRFDRDEVLTMWAVDLAVANWDGYTRNFNNYLLYHATASDRWYFIPWGTDTAFRGGGMVYGGLLGHMAVACHNDRACSQLLDAAVLDVIDTWEAIDLLGYAQTTWSTIQQDCYDDPRRNMGCDTKELVQTLTNRPAQARSEVK